MNRKKEIEKILAGEYQERFAIDGNLLISLSMVLIYKQAVSIWGAGNDIDTVIDFFRASGCTVSSIIDSNPEKQGMIMNGVEVLSLAEFKNKANNEFVFILTSFCDHISMPKFTSFLYECNIEHYYILSEMDRRIITTNTHDWIDSNRKKYYRENINSLVEFADNLVDEQSFQVLRDYLKSYSENAQYKGDEISTRYKYFFDPGKKELYKAEKNEIWLNCGASVGDTIFSYYSWGCKGNNTKIIAVEANKRNYQKLVDNIKLLPEEVRNNVLTVNKFIDEDFDIGNYLKEGVSLINADIEGGELDLLKALSNLIICNRPVLAICMYHKKEDLVEIPKYINSIVDGYSFKLRKYTAWIGNYNRNHELVLYAIPNERMVNK